MVPTLLLATALLAPLTLALPHPGHVFEHDPDSVGAAGYNPEMLMKPDYVQSTYKSDQYLARGQPEPNCQLIDQVVFKDKCLDYEEKTCYSQSVEKCEYVPYRNCTGTIKTKVDRRCFNVEELICGLEEKVEFDTLQEDYSVQICTVVEDRVCDITYNIEVNPRQDFQCCDVERQICEKKEVVIDDVTCEETSEFDCTKEKPADGDEPEETVCRPVPKRDCFKTPRTILKEQCRPDNHRFCQNFTNTFPWPEEKETCHLEPKKVCKIQKRTRERKAKRYSYSQDCKVVPREVCDQVETKSVVPACTTEERLQCTYEPEETCNSEPKQYCYKEEAVEKMEVCDDKFSGPFGCYLCKMVISKLNEILGDGVSTDIEINEALRKVCSHLVLPDVPNWCKHFVDTESVRIIDQLIGGIRNPETVCSKLGYC